MRKYAATVLALRWPDLRAWIRLGITNEACSSFVIHISQSSVFDAMSSIHGKKPLFSLETDESVNKETIKQSSQGWIALPSQRPLSP